MLDHLLQDIRYGTRTIIKNSGLAIVIVLSLALGIGANTAIFSVTSALLLKPLAISATRSPRDSLVAFAGTGHSAGLAFARRIHGHQNAQSCF